MAEIRRMIEEVRADRAYFAAEAKRGKPHLTVDAAACAIRERALLDALAAIEKERT